MTQASIQNGKRVLAISSGGGHWVQLLRLRPAFEGNEVIFACTDPDAASQVTGHEFHSYPDSNFQQPLRALWTLLHVTWLVLRLRPDVIVSTGAAGGAMAIGVGRLLGIRGLFVDSIANARRLSMSARISLKLARSVFTQWRNVAEVSPAVYRGSVL